MTAAIIPAKAPDTMVLRGNSWTFQITCPTDDTADNPLAWGTFAVASEQTDAITVEQDGTPPVVTLSLTGEQTEAVEGRWVHWYLAENTVMGGNEFVTGRIEIRDPQ